jgi:hypothetical protein
VEDDLQQEVAELGAELAIVAGVDRLGDLVGLLDRLRLDRRVRLLAVPGAAAGTAQAVHDAHQLLECFAHRHRPQLPRHGKGINSALGGGPIRVIRGKGLAWIARHGSDGYY